MTGITGPRTSLVAIATVSLIGLTLASCGQNAEDDAAEVASASNTVDAAVYQAAVAHPARPAEDKARDGGRKPAEVLEFMGIAPGMKVLDMFSGGGWYAEVMAHVVGEDGHVIAHTNTPYMGFVGDALQERFEGGRVANVEILIAENNELSLEENSLDAVMLAQSFHDMYHVDNDNGWTQIDGIAFLAELKRGLKPGGIVAIIDHAAAPGSPAEVGDTLHRIDPELVVANMEAAGFICEATSDLLTNADDDLSQIVFADGIRGNTSRFAMRFRNPL